MKRSHPADSAEYKLGVVQAIGMRNFRTPPADARDAPLAQLAEQVTLNHWVVGSIPTRCRAALDGVARGLKSSLALAAG